MIIKNAVFDGSYQYEKDCPATGLPEFAFIGRSNVGKSSLINMLCEQKGLAKVSQSPGKTQTINFFTVDDTWYLVDLPGYGYARQSKTTRAEFSRIITEYFKRRETLACAIILIDGMLPPQKIDLEFLGMIGQLNIPFVLAFTKTDRVKLVYLKQNIKNFETKLLENWNVMPHYFITSAEKKGGKEEILEFVEDIMKDWVRPEQKPKPEPTKTEKREKVVRVVTFQKEAKKGVPKGTRKVVTKVVKK
jgi:GTP-binding protein